MSQTAVERVIGALATDEALRLRFMRNPNSVLVEMMEKGLELTVCELWSLSHLDRGGLARFASVIDGRLQKARLDGGDL